MIIELLLNKIFIVIRGEMSYTVYTSDPPSRTHFNHTALLMTYVDIIQAVPQAWGTAKWGTYLPGSNSELCTWSKASNNPTDIKSYEVWVKIMRPIRIQQRNSNAEQVLRALQYTWAVHLRKMWFLHARGISFSGKEEMKEKNRQKKRRKNLGGLLWPEVL